MVFAPNQMLTPNPSDDPTGQGIFEYILARLKALGLAIPSSKNLLGASGTVKYEDDELTVNQSGTAGFVVKLLNITQTAIGSGAKLFEDFQVATVSKYKVAYDGTLTLAGDIVMALGKGLQLKTGSNARVGTATLAGGTVTIANTSVTANTIVLLTRKTNGGTVGNIGYVATPATGFVVTSSSSTDTSVFNYVLIEAI